MSNSIQWEDIRQDVGEFAEEQMTNPIPDGELFEGEFEADNLESEDENDPCDDCFRGKPCSLCDWYHLKDCK